MDIERWVIQSRLSDPLGHAVLIADLPPRVSSLNRVVQGLLIHLGQLKAYGIDESEVGQVSRTTLPVAERLDDVLKIDGRALGAQRAPARRSVGTCRDFALMLCSFLRGKGIPSRVRCGFAAYLGAGWGDHWVCEYWDGQVSAWRLSDAQMDEVLRKKYRILFDPADVPRAAFMTAGQAWLECRAGKHDPELFGHDDARGLWFIKVNVFRDHLSLNNREASAWDSWRDAPEKKRVVSDGEVALLDHLAAHPEQAMVESGPDWQV